MVSCFGCVLGYELRSSHFYGKCFTLSATCPAQGFVCFVTECTGWSYQLYITVLYTGDKSTHGAEILMWAGMICSYSGRWELLVPCSVSSPITKDAGHSHG